MRPQPGAQARFRAAVGDDAGGGAPCAEGAGPGPRSQEGTSAGPLRRPGLGPAHPSGRGAAGTRNRGPPPASAPGVRTSGPAQPEELGLCRRARPRPRPSAPLSELPPLLAPGLETQNQESKFGVPPWK